MKQYDAEKEKIKFAKRYARNPEYFIDRAKKYYSENSKDRKAYGRSHYQQNKELYKARSKKRKALIKEGTLMNSASENAEISMYFKFRDLLNRLHGRPVFNIDHQKPLFKGGAHHPSNIALVTAKYNHWKRVRIVLDPGDYFTPGGRR